MFGILLIDKPKDWTSHDVCQKTKRILGEKRIGHTGTLDPMATGLLVLCVGEATKVVKYLTNHDKTYEATITFGIQTDTEDITGKVLKREVVKALSIDQLDDVLRQSIGLLKQTVPMYSAVKVMGKKLYEYARANQTVADLPSREIEIKSISRLTDVTFEDGLAHVKLRVHVSKGTYIRSLATYFGNQMNLPATLSELKRTQIGQFTMDEAISIDAIDSTKLGAISLQRALSIPTITMLPEMEKSVANGAMLEGSHFPFLEDTLLVDEHNQPVAIYTYDPTKNKMRVSVKFHAHPISD